MSSSDPWTRRQMLAASVPMAFGARAVPNIVRSPEVSQQSVPPRRLGLVVYCSRLRRAALQKRSSAVDLFHPSVFLEHCRDLGAGGMQIDVSRLDAEEAATLRDRAAEIGLYVEAIVRPPFEPRDVERFDKQMRVARSAGAVAARTTIIPGRRYEYFKSLEHFREFDARAGRALELAAPIAEKYQLPLAVENHKDHRDAQRVELFERISSEFVGACVDTGNSFALLEDPVETVTALAPWAHSVHLKDQAVQLTDDGFLLGDIPLGQGFLPLPGLVKILREARPHLQFSLELITRDPLRVPCLSGGYWATFPDVPGSDLARTLRAVRDGAADELQYPDRLSAAERVELEDANVRASLAYAKESLGL